MKFEWSPKRSWEDYGPNKGWNNDAMGKWAIAQLSDGKLYWFYGDGGDPISYGTRHGLWFRYKGYIDTWSRDFHCYEDDSNSFDEVSCDINSHEMGLSSHKLGRR
jgi:hypothetical protein